jgi:hypothetical protein
MLVLVDTDGNGSSKLAPSGIGMVACHNWLFKTTHLRS